MDTEELKDIVASLKRLKSDEGLEKLDDNVLFDSAVRIYNSVVINRARFGGPRKGEEGQEKQAALQTRAGEQKIERVEPKEEKTQQLTDKQRKLLQSLNYKGNMNIKSTMRTTA